MLEGIRTFFNEAGWLANAIGILAPAGTLALAGLGYVKLFVNPARVEHLVDPAKLKSWSASDAKRVAKVAIVDDQLVDFPVAELRRDGFAITTYKQVHVADIDALATFDIVFLDMKGIVKDDPEYGGLKLIAQLRQLNPVQKICAVSSKTFDPTATEFFKQADDYKRKPLTAQECKDVIERFIGQGLDLQRLYDAAKDVLQQRDRATRKRLITQLKGTDQSPAGLRSLEGKLKAEGLDARARFELMNLYRLLNA